MPSSLDYIRSLEKEIERLKKVNKFYEDIILSDKELTDKLKQYTKYYGKNDRRNNYDNSQRKSR